MKILSFGEIIWDVFPNKKCIGGAPFNFSAHAVKQGAQVFLASAVGRDELGNEAVQKAKEFGVNVDLVATIGMPTGVCNVTLDENGVPSYDLLQNVAYDYISTDAICGNFDALYFGTLALRGDYNKNQIRKILEKYKACNVFCDVNIRPPYYDEESVKICFENATIIKISDEEKPTVEKILFAGKSEGIERFQERLAQSYPNLKIVIITAGSKGSYVFNTDTKERAFCPATPTSVVSTVGAGDSYSATFLVEYLSGNSMENCMKKASDVSASVVAKEGAI